MKYFIVKSLFNLFIVPLVLATLFVSLLLVIIVTPVKIANYFADFLLDSIENGSSRIVRDAEELIKEIDELKDTE